MPNGLDERLDSVSQYITTPDVSVLVTSIEAPEMGLEERKVGFDKVQNELTAVK